MKVYQALLILLTLPITVQAQGNIVSLGNDSYHVIDRLTIKSDTSFNFFTNIRPYNRKDIIQYSIKIDNSLFLSQKDEWDLNWIYRDNNDWFINGRETKTLTQNDESFYKKKYIDSLQLFYIVERNDEVKSKYQTTDKPLLKYFYRTPANFFEIDKAFFQLRINPIINFQYANARNNRQPVFLNQRGVELRGNIDNRIFFYTNYIETQGRFANYINQYVDKNGTLPGAGATKKYKSNFFDIENGFDYPFSTALLSFNMTKHVGVRFGHGTNFIGDGYRSLFLSNFAGNYFYLQLNWNVWKFYLQNTFAELTGGAGTFGNNNVRPKKYMAQHYLGLKLGSKFRAGLIETIIFQRESGFELQYLNPIIVYRTVEFIIGSPDNVMVGLDLRWDLFRRLRLYGQLNFDEFIFSELFLERRKSWTNKYSVQLGAKYIDAFGINHLDFQLEYNIVRPYTYQHFDSLSNFTHFQTPLAHPLGANFTETLFRVQFRPFAKLKLDAKYFFIKQGESAEGLNVGESLLLDYTSRNNGTGETEFGHTQNQGIKYSSHIFSIDVSYQFLHNMYLEVTYFRRDKNSFENSNDLFTEYLGGGVRLNIGRNSKIF